VLASKRQELEDGKRHLGIASQVTTSRVT